MITYRFLGEGYDVSVSADDPILLVTPYTQLEAKKIIQSIFDMKTLVSAYMLARARDKGLMEFHTTVE